MNPTIYKQLDSRWASKPYPTYASSFGGNGCGCCACVHVAMEQESKANWNPESLRPWMVDQGFAYVNQGTTWQGITATLKYIGHKEVVCVWNDPMSSAWAELDKGNRIGVLLVDNSSTPDGTYWTSSGHYVAFTDYKKDANGHWFYIKDSGGRNHDGWFCYEKSIRGALPKLWIVERIGKAPTPTKHTKMIDVSDFQGSIDWAKVKSSGVEAAIIRCGGRGGEAGVVYDDVKFLENIKGASKAGLSVGIYFLTQAITPAEGREEAQIAIKKWAESGIPISYPICIDSEDVTWKNEDGSTGYGRANNNKLSKAKRTEAIKAFAEECKRQGYTSMIYASTSWLYNQVDMKVLSPLMDVWCAQWASSCSYTGKYIIWQYSSEGSVNGIKGSVDMDKCYVAPKKMNPPKPAPTPTGEHYTGEYPNPKRYLEYGDKGTEVGKLQDYLNWYTDGAFYKECGGRDNIYGKNTLRYCNKMLTDFFGASEADGKVGPKTIAKMKAYTKPVKPTPTPKPYSSSFPSEAEIRQAASNGIREGIRAWCYDTFKGGKYGYKVFTDDPNTQICPICNNLAKKYQGWNCIGYAFASWKHGGGIPCNCNCGVIYNSLGDRYYDMSNIEVLKSMQSRIGTDDIKLIRNNNRAIPRTQLQMGDLLMFFSGSTYKHMGVYIGNGKVSDDANPSEGIRYGEPLEDFYPVLFAIRYTGTRSYLKLHDSGTAVAKWQDYLNWWSDGQFYKECGGVDGIFGSNTDKWTKKFQEKEIGKGQGDGLVGMKTITAAKKVVK